MPAQVGVTEEFAMSMCRLCSKASSEERSRHARFFTSLILSDLLSECGLPATMEKWGRVARVRSPSCRSLSHSRPQCATHCKFT
jgi:hypothetical protein